MNGVLRPDIGNVVMIGLIGFAGVWALNRVLRMAGMASMSTTGS